MRSPRASAASFESKHYVYIYASRPFLERIPQYWNMHRWGNRWPNCEIIHGPEKIEILGKLDTVLKAGRRAFSGKLEKLSPHCTLYILTENIGVVARKKHGTVRQTHKGAEALANHLMGERLPRTCRFIYLYRNHINETAEDLSYAEAFEKQLKINGYGAAFVKTFHFMHGTDQLGGPVDLRSNPTYFKDTRNIREREAKILSARENELRCAREAEIIRARENEIKRMRAAGIEIEDGIEAKEDLPPTGCWSAIWRHIKSFAPVKVTRR
ncbi:hypothetical protein [Chelatococcus asaccharovorans]|uniref:hypothetical protein n=1 Tax=Chelatococcus asaccharovorans TaxID=28210 RepID=UPI00224C6620|nr:hypothetical protein [Chelatococcus asaccharovorans]CAH1672611.1 conserved hypothetical protein [Chelatococcus asaccharovorans]CAH1675971.1 conserved hypothetical protein [Chelatococcus asaccharovorans]